MSYPTEQDMNLWQEDQRLCDIAEECLKILVSRQLSIADSKRVLVKVQTTIESSTESAIWGTPLACESVPNTAIVWCKEKVEKEVNRRLCEGTAARF